MVTFIRILIIAFLVLTEVRLTLGQTSGFDLKYSDDDSQTFENIKFGLSFDSIPEGITINKYADFLVYNRATISFEGNTFKVYNWSNNQTKYIAIDSNSDNEISSEEIGIIKFSEKLYFPLVVDSGKNEYKIGFELNKSTERYTYWFVGYKHATLTVNNEVLKVAVKILSDRKYIYFFDTDNDGLFETYHPKDNSFGLGGSFWVLSQKKDGSGIILSPSTKSPVSVGFQAPALDLFSSYEFKNRSKILIFCHSKCAGCNASKDKYAEWKSLFNDKDKYALIGFTKDKDDIGVIEDKIFPGYHEVYSELAFLEFGVTPTPTIVILDQQNKILYRGHHPTTEQVKNILRRN